MRRSALLAAVAVALVAGGALGYVAVMDGGALNRTTDETPDEATDAALRESVTDAPIESTDASRGTVGDTPRETTDISGGTAEVAVSNLRPFVVVGNESDSVPEGARTDVSCTDQEPFPGNATLAGRLTLERPAGDAGPANATFHVGLTAADGALRTNGSVTLAPGESTRTYLTTLVDQPDSLSGDDTVTVRAVVRTGNRTVATTARTVEVVERNVPCADGE